MNNLFNRANLQWENGELRSAFRLFLAAAKAGDVGAQHNLAYFYDEAIGVRRNRPAAMYWYRRAYRRGSRISASNIAVMFRDEGKVRDALFWFQRAARMRDGDAHLEIAKIYLNAGDVQKAITHLRKVLNASNMDTTLAVKDEANSLVSRLQAGSADRYGSQSRRKRKG